MSLCPPCLPLRLSVHHAFPHVSLSTMPSLTSLCTPCLPLRLSVHHAFHYVSLSTMPSLTSFCPPCLPLRLSVHHAFPYVSLSTMLPLRLSVHHAFPYVPLCITLQFLHHNTLCQVSYDSLLTVQSLRDSAVGLKSLDVLIGELSPEGYSFGEERDPHTGGSGELSRPNAPLPCHRHKSFTPLPAMHYRLCTSLGVVVNQIHLTLHHLVTATSPLPLCPLCTTGCAPHWG